MTDLQYLLTAPSSIPGIFLPFVISLFAFTSKSMRQEMRNALLPMFGAYVFHATIFLCQAADGAGGLKSLPFIATILMVGLAIYKKWAMPSVPVIFAAEFFSFLAADVSGALRGGFVYSVGGVGWGDALLYFPFLAAAAMTLPAVGRAVAEWRDRAVTPAIDKSPDARSVAAIVVGLLMVAAGAVANPMTNDLLVKAAAASEKNAEVCINIPTTPELAKARQDCFKRIDDLLEGAARKTIFPPFLK